MDSLSAGQKAEVVVGDYLLSQKYQILDYNWKTKVCEIDIVAKKSNVIYFVEVKYRSKDAQGSGLEYITPKKLNQIKFAVRVWSHDNDWGGDCRILVAEVSDLNFENINIIELSS